MTGLESLVVKELIAWAARALFDAVQDDKNDMTAEQAKEFSNNAAKSLSDDAARAITHHPAPGPQGAGYDSRHPPPLNSFPLTLGVIVPSWDHAVGYHH